MFGSVISENWIARRSCLALSSVNIIKNYSSLAMLSQLYWKGKQQQQYHNLCLMLEAALKILTFTLQSCPFKSAHKWISSAVCALLSRVCRCTLLYVSPWLTDGAVFTRPALVAVTLALSADSVVDAAWVTVPLLTFWSCPAFLAVTHTTYAGAVGATVHHTHLCRKKKSHGDM